MLFFLSVFNKNVPSSHAFKGATHKAVGVHLLPRESCGAVFIHKRASPQVSLLLGALGLLVIHLAEGPFTIDLHFMREED
jgi:hypothetical protein